ncbi:hypothetical protein QJQ45_013887, partial [Haematococcus lacustris]
AAYAAGAARYQGGHRDAVQTNTCCAGPIPVRARLWSGIVSCAASMASAHDHNGLALGPGEVQVDPEAIAAVTAALQQAAQLPSEQFAGVNMEEYYAQLAAMAAQGNAVGQDGMGMGMNMGMGMEQSNYDSQQAYGSDRQNKPKSGYRGVCWNKKNRRWQAAINAGGLYIYLGSFVQEIEAAKTFDRANLFLRGSRGKLNFGYELYVDAEGHLIPDQKLFGHITTMLQKGKGKRGRPGPGEVGGPSPNDVMVHTPGMEVSRLVAGTAAPQHNFPDPRKAIPFYPYNGAQRMTNGMFDMPHGCSATGYLPGDDECFAMLYTNPAQPEGMGVAVWDGTGCVDLGHYDTEKDARQAATTVLKLAIFQRHLLRSGPEIVSALQSEAAHQVVSVGGAHRPGSTLPQHAKQPDPNMADMGGMMGSEAEMAAVAAAVAAATGAGAAAGAGALGEGAVGEQGGSAAAAMPDLNAMLAAAAGASALGLPGQDGRHETDPNAAAALAYAQAALQQQQQQQQQEQQQQLHMEPALGVGADAHHQHHHQLQQHHHQQLQQQHHHHHQHQHHQQHQQHQHQQHQHHQQHQQQQHHQQQQQHLQQHQQHHQQIGEVEPAANERVTQDLMSWLNAYNGGLQPGVALGQLGLAGEQQMMHQHAGNPGAPPMALNVYDPSAGPAGAGMGMEIRQQMYGGPMGEVVDGRPHKRMRSDGM